MEIKSKFFDTKTCYVVLTPYAIHYIAMGTDKQWDDNYYYNNNYYNSDRYNNYDYCCYDYCYYDYYYNYYNDYYGYTLLNENPNY